MCRCDLPAKSVTCRKAGPHQGWLFLTCPKDNRVDDTACKFFKWILDADGKEVQERQGQFNKPFGNRRYNPIPTRYTPHPPPPHVEDLPPPPPVSTSNEVMELRNHMKFLMEYLLDNDKTTVILKDYYDKHFAPSWNQGTPLI